MVFKEFEFFVLCVLIVEIDFIEVNFIDEKSILICKVINIELCEISVKNLFIKKSIEIKVVKKRKSIIEV